MLDNVSNRNKPAFGCKDCQKLEQIFINRGNLTRPEIKNYLYNAVPAEGRYWSVLNRNNNPILRFIRKTIPYINVLFPEKKSNKILVSHKKHASFLLNLFKKADNNIFIELVEELFSSSNSMHFSKNLSSKPFTESVNEITSGGK